MVDLIATYYINDKKYHIHAIYDSHYEYEHNMVAYYEIYNDDNVCLNSNDPYYSFPSWHTVYNFVTKF